jgi:hypothetical protein
MVVRVVLVAGVGGLALLATGCGGSKSPLVANVGTTTATTSPPAASTRQSGVLYSTCMRAHGVSDFPDSAVSVTDGRVEIHVPLGIKNEAEFLSASKECQRDLPERVAPGKPSVSIQEQLQFANCMRSQGIADFPDPMRGGGFNVPDNVSTNTPRFEAAQNACEARSPGIPIGVASGES